MKRLAILGATGSIGTQVLDIVSQHPSRLSVSAMAAFANGTLLQQLASQHGAPRTALASNGLEPLVEMARADDVDMVVVAISGAAALLPTIAAIEAGKEVALATKEVLVAAGELVMPLCRKHGVSLIPIDSEHSAIFQCLRGYSYEQIRTLTLTASGGPFRGRKSLEGITVEQALNHPTWSMGGKITIDSASLMNKALEMIEAKWLFDVGMDQVKVCVHPQSVVHSLVEFHDGSMLGQLGWPDMRLPIQVALLWPDRISNQLRPWNPVETPNLTFEALDESVFPALSLAREAEASGGTAPCAFNAANEAAVALFLGGEIGFTDIFCRVERVLRHHVVNSVTLESLLAADAEARALVHG